MSDEEKKGVLYDKEALLWFRASLIRLSSMDFIKSIKSLNVYIEFLDTLSYGIFIDPHFFYFGDYLSKALSIMGELSIKYNTKGNIREVENTLKRELNNLNAAKDKEEMIREYIDSEYICRAELPNTKELILDSMGNDYAVLKIMQKEIEENNGEIKNIDCRQFVESTSYFIDMVPELYELHPEVLQASENYLTKLKKTNKNYKKYIKRTKERLAEFKV